MMRRRCTCCDKYFTAEKDEEWCARCSEEYESVRETLSARLCKFHACTAPMACEAQGKCLRELHLINPRLAKEGS